MDKAVILARGLGTRMRKADNDAALSKEQAAIAETGIKAMIPIDRPFLDYVMHLLAETGYTKICLVIGPEHAQVRDYYGKGLSYSRISVDFAIQEKPLGTADAVASAEQFANGDPILVINSDNYYPYDALKGLRELGGPGLAGFIREAMVEKGNIPVDRVTKFAVIETDAEGFMTRIIEKPSPEQVAALADPVCLSMNCWRFGPEIFEACKRIQPSSRGELELPDAVLYTMQQMGTRYRAIPVNDACLDMSSRSDIQSVVDFLKGSKVEL